MTLNTTFYITTPGIDPHKVWNELLDMVEPEGFLRTRFGYTQIQKADDKRWGWGPTGSTMTNTQVGIGLKAWCFMWHNEDGSALAYDDENSTDDPEKVDYDKDIWFEPRGYIKLDFDTAYGYGDEYGGCSDLHGRIVTHLASIVEEHGGEYIWKDEYTGEWFTDLSHVPDFGRF